MIKKFWILAWFLFTTWFFVSSLYHWYHGNMGAAMADSIIGLIAAIITRLEIGAYQKAQQEEINKIQRKDDHA